jgi:hypothetical protein
MWMFGEVRALCVCLHVWAVFVVWVVIGVWVVFGVCVCRGACCVCVRCLVGGFVCGCV